MAFELEILKELETLRQETDCNFVGIALQGKANSEVQWKYAAGNRNEKYKKIAVRYGKGIAGKVISSGQPLMVMDFPHQIKGKSVDYPIMLAEQLVTSFAVPLCADGAIKGVVLVGYRSNQSISDKKQELVKNIVSAWEKQFSSIFKGRRESV
ncbi:GAF domain-containing protein [Fictibacillus sp. KIGAM418]|uniref:GAF domain-containing protein n=1 Tax=Fictibacillus marinisediminis TaxID=2878389 RepID=A0A9X1XDW3_9BACL|nr:GAF domain-containing protein [Fictibacillus marinisediminis]MCK6259067.1 GAF domain-containing protein [Fictibacillus marinisediminis]